MAILIASVRDLPRVSKSARGTIMPAMHVCTAVLGIQYEGLIKTSRDNRLVEPRRHARFGAVRSQRCPPRAASEMGQAGSRHVVRRGTGVVRIRAHCLGARTSASDPRS